MTEKQFERLIKKYLLPYLPDFEVKGGLIFKIPLKEILVGFCFERSGFDKYAFYLNSFIQPLYVPSDFLHFSFGDRIGKKHGSSFTLEESDEDEIMNDVLRVIKKKGMKIIKKLDNPSKVAQNLIKFTDSPKNPYVLEAVAYSLILDSSYDKVLKIFDRIKFLIEEMEDVPEWYNAILSRIDQLGKFIDKSPNEAVELLNQWAKETAENLKLQKFYVVSRQ